MFRIEKIFENHQTELIKVEGEVNDSEVIDWADSLQAMLDDSLKQIILNFSELTFLCPKAVEALIHCMTPNLLLLNCPTALRNRIRAAGWPENILD